MRSVKPAIHSVLSAAFMFTLDAASAQQAVVSRNPMDIGADAMAPRLYSTTTLKRYTGFSTPDNNAGRIWGSV